MFLEHLHQSPRLHCCLEWLTCSPYPSDSAITTLSHFQHILKVYTGGYSSGYRISVLYHCRFCLKNLRMDWAFHPMLHWVCQPRCLDSLDSGNINLNHFQSDHDTGVCRRTLLSRTGYGSIWGIEWHHERNYNGSAKHSTGWLQLNHSMLGVVVHTLITRPAWST